MNVRTLALMVAASANCQVARADFLEWVLPGTNFVVPIEGRIMKGNRTRNSISIDHPKYGQIIFSPQYVRKVYYTADLKAKRLDQIRSAYRAQNPDEMYRLSLDLLKRAWLKEYNATVERVLELNPEHKGAKLVAKLREQMAADVPDGDGEKRMREIVRNSDMQIASSKHFIILHDLGSDRRAADKVSLIDARKKLLEDVYESFMLFFFARGAELEVPKEKLCVVFFKLQKDFESFAKARSPSLSSAAGFWDPEINVSFFYSDITDPVYLEVNRLFQELKDQERAMVRNKMGELRRLTLTMTMLLQLWQEELNIEVISHEATHQLAGSTGLLPRNIRVPFWIHEGLAMHFESPKGGSWAGIGAINENRLKWYKGLATNQRLANLDFIVGDELFNYARAGNRLSMLHDAYGQGWALTHFLLDKHFDATIKYYRELGKMPRELILTPQTLLLLFDRCFDKVSRKQLEEEFRSYMSKQETDFDRAIRGAKSE